MGDIKFYSITYRAFKITELEDRCEDYGQTAIYNGGMKDGEDEFKLDKGHIFVKGKKTAVCKNTADMILKSRFNKYFTVTEPGIHRGLFDCSGCDEQ